MLSVSIIVKIINSMYIKMYLLYQSISKKFFIPKYLRVKINKTKPLSELESARPSTLSGDIKISEKIILETRAIAEILAAWACLWLEYNHKENILAKPKGRRPHKNIVRVWEVIVVSFMLNAPRCKII